MHFIRNFVSEMSISFEQTLSYLSFLFKDLVKDVHKKSSIYSSPGILSSSLIFNVQEGCSLGYKNLSWNRKSFFVVEGYICSLLLL